MIGTDGKMVSPGEIIPTAERVGLIRDIDRWVARRAIDMLAEAESNGDHVLFSVNLSGTAFGDETLLRLMRDRFAATGARPDHLVVEITETTAIANIEAARRFILGLKEIGCRFALDDFGSGTSSFYYLKHLPIDFLKIDGSIVTGSSSSATDVHFLRAIVEMCKGLNVRTVAEYVEDEQLFDLISDEGVDFAQGFYVGRPQPLATYLKPGRPHLALPVPRLAFAAAALETQTA
jgi:EAL domain-containing protein (putative c-di-GMP-specific phosphodiesterase class I)